MRKRFSFSTLHNYNFTAIERKLEAMSRKGWMPEEMTTLLWRYRPVEPRARCFQVVYTQSDTPAEIKKYESIFRAEGWALEAFMDHMLIFCHENSDAPRVFLDPQAQFDAIQSLRGRPTLWLLALSLISLILRLAEPAYEDGLSSLIPYLLDTTKLVTSLISVLLLFQELLQGLQYALWQQRARAFLRSGDSLPPFSDWSLLYNLLFAGDGLICLLATIYTIATGGLFTVVAMTLTLSSALGIGLFLFWKLSTRDMPRPFTIAVSMIVPLAATLIMALCWAPVNHSMVEPEQCQGLIFDADYTHVYPVTLQEITDGEQKGALGYYEGYRSFFVQQIYSKHWTNERDADREHELEYRLTYHQLPQLRGICLDYHRDVLSLRKMEPVGSGDCDLWQAQSVQLYRNQETGTRTSSICTVCSSKGSGRIRS